MRAPLVLAALLLASTALAGCGADDGPVEIEVAPGQVVVVDEPPKPGNGRVAGIVGDDALYPLSGALVRLLGTEPPLEASTDDGGRFAIVDVPPGIYIVEGIMKDHASTQATVDVQPEKTAKAVLLLPRIPPTDPFHLTFVHDGSVELSGGEAYVFGRNNSFSFNLEPSEVKSIILESKWSGTFIGTGQRPPLVYKVSNLALEVIIEEAVPNPFVTRIDRRVLTPGHDRFNVEIGPNQPEPILYQGRSQDFLTVFYNEPAPADWSILGGSQ